MSKGNENSNRAGFLNLDIVFEATSLNYDTTYGTISELKKIHRIDGVYTLISRQSLRYSLLETAEKEGLFKLASDNDFQEASAKGGGEGKVIQPNPEKIEDLLKYPEFDLFGYMVTDPETLIRKAPVRITHAVSLEPYRFDTHFSTNLGVARRAGKENQIYNIEEHKSLYLYSVFLDLSRIGKAENKQYEMDKQSKERYERVEKLLRLLIRGYRREVKGKYDFITPLLIIASYAENTMPYSFNDRIWLENSRRKICIDVSHLFSDGDGAKSQIENVYYKSEVFESVEFKPQNTILTEKTTLQEVYEWATEKVKNLYGVNGEQQNKG